MRLLLDTHILLWLMANDRRLTQAARGTMQRAAEVYVSTASIWEIAIKWQLGKIEEDPELVTSRLEPAGLRELAVTNAHALATARLPLLHRDPFDRLLVAQAEAEDMRLLTADPRLEGYSERVIRV